MPRLSEAELEALKAGTPRSVETANGFAWQGSTYAMSTLRGCASRLGVSFEVVLRCAEQGKLGQLIEQRSGAPAAKRNVARIEYLYRRRELSIRQTPPW